MSDFVQSWRHAWGSIGAADDGIAIHDALVAAYRDPRRKYHGLQHLGECLALFAANRGLAAQPAEVEIALWFHDAVYEVGNSDNEERSAAWAMAAAIEGGAPRIVAGRIHSLIMATRHAEVPTGGDEPLLVDIDLAILGASESRFAEYERQVREEYAHVPEALFRAVRGAILRSFLGRERIYSTPRFHLEFEGRARANLARSIARCDAPPLA